MHKYVIIWTSALFVLRQVCHYVEADPRWNQLWRPPKGPKRTLSLCERCCDLVWWSVCPVWVMGRHPASVGFDNVSVESNQVGRHLCPYVMFMCEFIFWDMQTMHQKLYLTLPKSFIRVPSTSVPRKPIMIRFFFFFCHRSVRAAQTVMPRGLNPSFYFYYLVICSNRLVYFWTKYIKFSTCQCTFI